MSGISILNGNELLIQGGLEAGFNLYTGYPGSPLADFFNILHERKEELKQQGIRVVIANSEAHAAAMASGAKMAGQNVLVGMKSMGLHVASDALSVGNFACPAPVAGAKHKPGVVIAVGDDPWSISTSTPADSRFLFKHLHIPFLEPSTPQELKDWMGEALKLSQDSSVYTGILLTTFMAEGGGRVTVGEQAKLETELITLEPKHFNLAQNVMVPPNSLMADRRMIEERFPKVLAAREALKLDQIFGNKNAKIGVISCGAVFETLKQVLEESGLLDQVHLYKCAGAYPLDRKHMLPFLKGHPQIIVVEEKRAFLEMEVKELAQSEGLNLKILGKEFVTDNKVLEGFPAWGGLNYETIYKKMLHALDIFGWEGESNKCLKELPTPLRMETLVPKRLPTFCPGCPHRETLSIMKEIRKSLDKKGVQLISHGDVGCYSLSFLEPFKEMHDLSAMGQGGAMGAGTDIFTTNPSVVLMGDSTFFHSGMTAISNSVQLGHNITYILLDNDNTAMTGHQVTPRTGVSVDGGVRPRQNMLDVARSLKVSEAIEVNPSDRYFYKNLLEEMVMRKGVKVIVSNKECGLTFHGRKKRDERKLFKSGGVEAKRSFYQINTLACEDCRECVEMTGCPGLSQTQDAYGSKVMIDPQICVSDSYCTKLKACPSFELVEVTNYHPNKYKKLIQQTSTITLSLPTPKISLTDIASGKDYRVIVIGVGGSGVTTISRVLAEAAREMDGRTDIDFKFVDQKGLAQRNGSVTGHLALFAKGKSHGQVVPLGSADLVLSPDLLEGSRALEFLSDSGLLAVDADFQVPLSIMLDRGFDKAIPMASDFQTELATKLQERLLVAPFKNKSFERFERPVYASAMLLGSVFQAGQLPFSLQAMEAAFKRAVPSTEFATNWQAFELGRQWVIEHHQKTQETSAELSQWKVSDFAASVELIHYPWQNKREIVNSFNHARRELSKLFPAIPEVFHAQYVHDLLVFDQGTRVSEFLADAKELSQSYDDGLAPIALRTLAKTYWIKDEIFVSHLMIAPHKLKSDRERYGKLGTSYKVIHINRPSFQIGNRKIEFDFSPKGWMLSLMRHMRVLRKLMPQWHSREREISHHIRHEILNVIPQLAQDQRYRRLVELETIKGYREVRYRFADQFLQAKV